MTGAVAVDEYRGAPSYWFWLSCIFLSFFLNPSIQGGYIGVTVFFVLSGYLVTSNTLPQCGNGGTIDVKEFFRRRALRIVPALLVMLAVVVLAACWTMSRAELQPVLQSATAAAAAGANFWMLGLSSEYFSDESRTTMLLHTW